MTSKRKKRLGRAAFERRTELSSSGTDEDTTDDDINRPRLGRYNSTLYEDEDAGLMQTVETKYARFSELHGILKEVSENRVKEVAQEIQSGRQKVNKGSVYNDGKTMLHVACEYGAVDVVDMLVNEFDANVSVLDNTDQTPLHLAAGNGHTEIVSVLCNSIDYSDDLKDFINSTDHYGMTAVMYACDYGCYRVVRYLCGVPGLNISNEAYGGEYMNRSCIDIAQVNMIKFRGSNKGNSCKRILLEILQPLARKVERMHDHGKGLLKHAWRH